MNSVKKGLFAQDLQSSIICDADLSSALNGN